jgi:hypothetical protein
VDASGAIVELPEGEAAGVIENRSEAEERAALQEKVWDLVWWRRVVYFSSVLVAALLILFPLLWPALDACQSRLCGISWVVGAAGAVLPSAASPWLEAWETRPTQLARLLFAFVMLLLLSGWLRTRIFDDMRVIWTRGGTPAPDPRGRLYRLRTSAVYVWLWKRMKWFVLPALAGTATLFLLLAGASKVLFDIASSAGYACAPTPHGERVADRLEAKTFTPDSVCWASGVMLTEDVTYRVTIVIDDPAEWGDTDAETGIAGYRSTRAKYGQLPFRRYLRQAWYKPIARIGERGGDEYPLDPADILNKSRAATTLVSNIKARRSGELFLFVNDAVWPVPSRWQIFYGDNWGSATIEVRPARTLREPKPAPEALP